MTKTNIVAATSTEVQPIAKFLCQLQMFYQPSIALRGGSVCLNSFLRLVKWISRTTSDACACVSEFKTQTRWRGVRGA
ncbi:hypothetical protein Brsp01_27970 [Brucella sp. NBRC 12950]|nr:hypothetical protein Brsp01_27970 [Brucella sp. NBRC 12950]